MNNIISFLLLLASPLRAGMAMSDANLLHLPQPGDYQLRVISPTVLELTLITQQSLTTTQSPQWDFVSYPARSASLPSAGQFAVSVTGSGGSRAVGVVQVGFKKQTRYASTHAADLRMENTLYLTLASPLADGTTVQVDNPDASLWPPAISFTAFVDPLRWSPVIHVNQVGYGSGLNKKAMAGYFLGSLGELNMSGFSSFDLIDEAGTIRFTGSLTPRPAQSSYKSSGQYQQVLQADFSTFTTPGQYRLQVPGLGSSLPFFINDGVPGAFARTYALGIYHQRCGTRQGLPYTRFYHCDCHDQTALVPGPGVSSAADADLAAFTQGWVPHYSTTPVLSSVANSLYPFVAQGRLDISHGHHDAGDYSKYSYDSALLIHYLTFAADALPGVADLDNLGLPESGDGKSDVLEEAKWEADFLIKTQDDDGGFYYLVYPQNRPYEYNVLPDGGDPQIVLPKTIAATAGAVGALAELASSPRFKAQFPQSAALYLERALRGWAFMQRAFAKFDPIGSFQRISVNQSTFADTYAWAAAGLFVATGDPRYQTALQSFLPTSMLNNDCAASPLDGSSVNQYCWSRPYWGYGTAIRDIAFAVSDGRLNSSQLDLSYQALCQNELLKAGDDMLGWAQMDPYNESLPEPELRFGPISWFFTSNQNFNLIAAYQMSVVQGVPKSAYLDAIVGNFNFELGTNPANASYLSGAGWKRSRIIVSQYHDNDRRALPPTGILTASVHNGFAWGPYGQTVNGRQVNFLVDLDYPAPGDVSAPFPNYELWGDMWNVRTEYETINGALSLAAAAYLMANAGGLANQAWTPPTGAISLSANPAQVNVPVTASLSASGLDLSQARITWEAQGQDPVIAPSFAFTPPQAGSYWIEAEAMLPDGRRVFAAANLQAQ